MSIEEFIIAVYCLVDEALKNLLKEEKLRRRGFQPTLSDSEMITMELVAEFQGIDTDKQAWEYFSQHWKDWFATLGSRSNYAKHAANLWQMKQRIQVELASKLGSHSDFIHLCDGFPMKNCHFKRAYFSQIFKGEASYGYCASKAETYYGFKGNVIINSEDMISGLTVSAANIDERESLWDMLTHPGGLLIADKGLIGADYQETLYRARGINLQTAVRANMKEKRSHKIVT